MKIRKFGEPVLEETGAASEQKTISAETMEEMRADLATIGDELKLNLKALNDWKNTLKNFISSDVETNTPVDDIHISLEQIIDNFEKDLNNFEDIKGFIEKSKEQGNDYLI